MLTIFDSNVWIAHLNQADSQHKKAIALFAHHTGLLILPEQIFFEVVTVLHLKAGATLAKKFLEFALENADVKILYAHKNLALELLQFFQKNAYAQLSLTDHLLLLLSREYEIVTFDQALIKVLSQNVK